MPFFANQVYVTSPENMRLFKEAVINYLNGTDYNKGRDNITEVKNHIRSACTYRTAKIDAKTLAKNIPLSGNTGDETLDPEIIQILTHLHLPTQKSHYTDQGINNLYELLTRQKKRNLDYLIELIDDTYPHAHWFNYVYPPALAIIGVLGLSYMQPQYFWMAMDWLIDMIPVVYHWVYHYMVQLNNLPVIGMGIQFGLILYYLNYTFEHGLDPSEERIRTLFFRALAIAFNFLAHLITYWAAGTFSWIPASIFIISSFVGIIESIYTYCKQKPAQSENEKTLNVHTRAWGVRYERELERNKNIFLIRLIYAFTITGLVLGYTFLVPSVILTMAYTLSLGLAFLIKDYCINKIKKGSANEEQLAVLEIYNKPEFNPAQKLEDDINAFYKYAREVLAGFDSNHTINELLQVDIVEILTNKIKPFRLEDAKNNLDICVRCYEKSTVNGPPSLFNKNIMAVVAEELEKQETTKAMAMAIS